MQLDVRHRHQRALAQFFIVAQFRVIVPQQLADPCARARPDFWSQRHERIELCRGEHSRLDDVEPAVLRELPEIEHVIADRDADARGEAVLGGEDAVGEILDREVGSGRDGDEGAEFGVVGMGHGISAEFLRLYPPVIAGMRHLAQARNPWSHLTSDARDAIPGSRFARPGMTADVTSRLVRIEPLLQSLPAIGVIVLQRRRLSPHARSRAAGIASRT